VLLVLASTGACQEDEAQGGSLDNGSFVYACVSAADPQCPDDELGAAITAFPTIALGGTFSVTYSSTNSSYPSAEVSAVSPEYFLSQGETFTAIRSGNPSFVAETPDGTTLDFTQVDVEPITTIHIDDTTANAGDETGVHTFTATALGQLGQSLGGVVLYEWASSDPSSLEIVPGQTTPSSSVNVMYRKSGTATLTARSGETRGSIAINAMEGE
jgi:hypothetical protein